MPFPNADHIASGAGSFEPQLSPRFSFEISGLDGNDSETIVLSLDGFTPPVESNEAVEILQGNEKRRVAGQADFQNATLVVKDFVDAGIRDALHRWRRKVYNPETGLMGYARDYKKQASLIWTGPDGQSQRVYTLIGVWPTEMNPGAGDMNSSDNIKIEMTLAVDKAIYVV
jgi:hypothetical protein